MQLWGENVYLAYSSREYIPSWGQGPWQQECEAGHYVQEVESGCPLPLTDSQQGSASKILHPPQTVPPGWDQVVKHGPMGHLRFNSNTGFILHSIKLGVAARCQHTLSSVRSVCFAYCPFCDCVLLAVFVSLLAHTQMHGF